MRTVVAVVVRDGEVIAYATNQHTAPCRREGYPTGQGYELCTDCNYPNHAEYKAVQGDVRGGHLLIIGHTYACDPCKEAMLSAGVTYEVYPQTVIDR